MKLRTIIRRGTVAAIAAALLSASPAAAQLGQASIDCRADLAKAYGKLLKSAHKTIAGCHKARDKDVLLVGTDCNDMTAADAAKLKFDKAADKFELTVTDVCAGQGAILTAGNVGGGTEYYVDCPVAPCDNVTGVIDTLSELGACLRCEAAAVAEEAGDATLGLPNPADLNSEEQKCHGAIAKGYAKYFATEYKNENACQGDQDVLGDNTLTACTDTPLSDTKGTTAGSLVKAGEGLDKACSVGVNLADLDGCSAVDLASLKTCSGVAWGDAEDEAFEATYQMEATTSCPTGVRTTILGGCSTVGSSPGVCSSGFQTGSTLSVGWKGLAHGVDITDSYTIAVDVVCPGPGKGACGDCVSQGVSLDNPQYESFTRCVNDAARTCDSPFANDIDCGVCLAGININDACTTDAECPGSTCAAQACRYFLGPPLAVSAGGTPTCTMNVINTDIVGGTGDPDVGTADFLVDLRAIVHLGVSQGRPCPYCRNDLVPQDGIPNGTCFDGPHDGDACDVQGFDLSFANPQGVDLPNDGNSLDCPPSSGANISGGGLAIELPLTTGTSSKDAVDPCESPNAANDCFCGVCSGDPAVSCDSDTDCANLLLGTCGIGAGVDRNTNNCSDGICSEIVNPGPLSDRGQCSGDIDSYCTGLLFASGKGVITCGVDADCEAYQTGLLVEDDWVCPGDNCGSCTHAQYRSCFKDPMEVTGTPDPFGPILAGTFCLPPSSNGSVNNATGSPGPGTVQTDTIVELRY